jgi:hypothetical protein
MVNVHRWCCTDVDHEVQVVPLPGLMTKIPMVPELILMKVQVVLVLALMMIVAQVNQCWY